MSESACLRRSLSQPIGYSSHEEIQEDPLEALTESVSFGRFTTEPLAWDKWSAFTRNRYLEEAERYSKPGSVAEKRAYFEAHFKRKAAERAAAAALALLDEHKGKECADDDDRIDVKEVNKASKNSPSPPPPPPKVPSCPATKQTTREPGRAENSLIAITGKKFVKCSATRKSERSIHSSVNLLRSYIKKTTSPTAQKTRSSKCFFTSSLNVSKSKVPTNGTSKSPFPNLESEYGSARPLLNKSVTKGIAAESSAKNSKSSNGRASKPRSSITSSPFNLRSEERAARRKEFYEKLEERRNAEEAAKKLQQTKHQTKQLGKKPSSNKSAANQLPICCSQKNARENSSPNIQNSAS